MSTLIFSSKDFLKETGHTSRRLKLGTISSRTRVIKMFILHDLRVRLSTRSIIRMLSLSCATKSYKEVVGSKNDLDVKVIIVPGARKSLALSNVGLYSRDIRRNTEVMHSDNAK